MDVRKEGTVFKIRALVFYFQKRAGMTSSPTPASSSPDCRCLTGF